MDFYINWAIAVIVFGIIVGIYFVILNCIKKNKMKIINIKLKISNLNPKENINKKLDRIFSNELKLDNKYLKEWDKIRSPLMIGYLCDEKINYRHTMATLLNFVLKGYIEIIQIGPKEEHTYKLKKEI